PPMYPPSPRRPHALRRGRDGYGGRGNAWRASAECRFYRARGRRTTCIIVTRADDRGQMTGRLILRPLSSVFRYCRRREVTYDYALGLEFERCPRPIRL